MEIYYQHIIYLLLSSYHVCMGFCDVISYCLVTNQLSILAHSGLFVLRKRENKKGENFSLMKKNTWIWLHWMLTTLCQTFMRPKFSQYRVALKNMILFIFLKQPFYIRFYFMKQIRFTVITGRKRLFGPENRPKTWKKKHLRSM